MRVRALGPLELWDGQSWRSLGSPKQQLLLSVLIATHGRVASVEWLIDEVWEGEPPRGARNQLQGLVMRLRRHLGDSDASILRTQRPGYVLELADEDLDIRQFETLRERGEEARKARDFHRTSSLLSEALDLWRGIPFAGMPPVIELRNEAERLEHLRVTTLESRIEVDLRIGRDSSLIPELRELVEQHPLRETFWHQLMLALLRSGQPGAALAAYDQLCRFLAEELGTEPGTRLRDLHRRIREADPTLHLDPEPETETDDPGRSTTVEHDRGSAVPPTPRQLPAALTSFVGREDALRQADAALAETETGTPALLITGMAGVGKTTLAVRWAHDNAHRFPDGQLFTDLRGFSAAEPRSPDEVLHQFLAALGVPPERRPDDLSEAVDLYRAMLADKRIMVVLDNADSTDQVRPLLPSGEGCAAIVTSRRKMAGLVSRNDARVLIVPVLEPTDARAFFTARIGEQRAAAEPAAVERIVERCGGLPLALATTSARIVLEPQASLSSFAEELSSTTDTLESLYDHEGDDLGVDAVFSWSYRRVSSEAARMFRLCGLQYGRSFSVEAAASAAAVGRSDARRALDELANASLVSTTGSFRYSMHDLLRSYAQGLCERTESATELDAARRRILEHYVLSLSEARHVLQPQRPEIVFRAYEQVVVENFDDAAQARSWFERENDTLLEIVRSVDSTPTDDGDRCVSALALMMHPFQYRSGRWRDIVHVCLTAADAGSRRGDRAVQARAHRFVASGYSPLGEHERAREEVRKAIDLASELDATEELARSHIVAAMLATRRSDGAPREVIEHAEHALSLHERDGDQLGIASALSLISRSCAALGEYDRALKSNQQAHELFRANGERLAQIDVLEVRGRIHYARGDYSAAMEWIAEGLRLSRELGAKEGIAELTNAMGDAQHAAGRTAEARESWTRAHELFRELAHPYEEQVRDKLDRQ